MADVKWIKITTDIFDDEKMYAIETQADGYLIELIWFKLLCLAGKCNNHGFLMINNKIAYTDEMLASIFRVEIGSVQRALMLFEQLEMIETVENAYMVSNWDKHQSSERLEEIKEQNRIRQQRHRDKQKQLALEDKESNVTNNVTDNVINNVNCSISYSNSISNSLSNNSNSTNTKNDKDTKHKYGEYKHVLLTDTERERLVNDYGEDATHDAIKYLDEYIEMSGKKYKNHNLALRKWVFDAIKRDSVKSGYAPSRQTELDGWANA